MLLWFRSRAAAVAAVVLLSLGVAGGTSLLAHHDDCHDLECAVGIVAHDAAAHRFQAASGPDASEHLHCLVCHWVRSFRPHLTSTFVTAQSHDLGVKVHADVFRATPATLAAQPPLRSPPFSI